MSLFKRRKRKGVPDEKAKREGNLSGSPVSPANVAELRPPSSSTESYSNMKHLASPSRPMNYTLENTTLFEGLNVTGVKASSSDKDTDSQGSADTSRSQHTDVTSELSSAVSLPDKNDDSQLNHSDHDDEDDHDGVKGSSFSFVRSDSTASKDGESSGDENHIQFAFIKEEDVTDDAIDDVPLSKSQEHEPIKPEAKNDSPSAGKVSSEEVDYGHTSELKVISVDHKLTIAHTEKDYDTQNTKLKTTPIKPSSLADTIKTNSDEHTVQSSVPATLSGISKGTPTAPVTKSAVAKKKRRAKRPGQNSQWKHEETPRDEIQMAKELHQSSSSSLVELKEPLNDIPEDNEEACTPSEDRVLAMPGAANNNTTIPAIQIEVTGDNSTDVIHRPSLSTIPEIQIMSDDASDSETVNEKGSSDNLSVSLETTIPVTNQKDSSPTELKTVTDDNSENNQSDSKEDVLDNSLDTSPQLKTTDYGIELSPEDKITVLVQTTDSKLSDIQASCDEVVANSSRSINGNIATVTRRIKKRKEYQQLREQETACLAEENYELAEELGAKMESLSMELECKLENTSDEVYKFMTDQLKILEEERQLRNEIVEKLKAVKCDEEEKLQNIEKEFSLLQLKEKKKLATIEDHINREKGYVGLDREHVLKAETSYKSERDGRCADYLAKKRSLSEEMSTLQEQIAEVEKQLATLKEKEMVLTTALNEEDAKVKTVEDEMCGEKQQIDAEWEKIHKREAELQDDINELEVNKSNYQKIEDEHNKTQQSHQQLVDMLYSWITMHNDQLKQLDQSNEVLQCCHGKTTAVNARASTPELNQLEEEKRSMNQQVKELTTKVFTVQTQMSQIQKTHSDINNRIPQLNEAKKAAVASRQYREAGQISQQIKALTQQLEEEQQQMSLLETELSSHTAQLLSLNQQVANMEAKIVSLRKEKDVTFLQRIFQQCKQLIEEANSNPSIPGLSDFLRSYSKLCRVLADEVCIKYSVELSDLELEDINIDDDDDDVEITTAERKSPNGSNSSLALDTNTSDSSSKDTASNSRPVNSSREEIEQEIANVESQIDSAVNSEDFELAATLDDKLKSLKETLKHI